MSGQVTIVSSGENLGVTLGANSLDVTTSQRVIDTLPVTWEDMVATYGYGYNYPQPSKQPTSYRSNDDEDVETSIFQPARVANALKPKNELATDFVTLLNNNSFGNTNRLTDSVGEQEYGSGSNGSLLNYIIDHYTGVAYIKDLTVTNLVWNDSIDSASGISLGGYDDYYVPRLNDFLSLAATGIAGVFSYAPWSLSTSSGLYFVTSSTDPYTTSSYFLISFRNRQLNVTSTSKTVASTSFYTIYARKHF